MGEIASDTLPLAKSGGKAHGYGLPLLLFGLLGALPLIGQFASESYLLSLITRVMIFSIAALSLDLLVGYCGLVSLGHAAFIGIGAYATGILASHGIGDALVALPVALAASALFALLTGYVCLRTKGIYFIMITLAFGQMVFHSKLSGTVWRR